jgi:hypothetical protein
MVAFCLQMANVGFLILEGVKVGEDLVMLYFRCCLKVVTTAISR